MSVGGKITLEFLVISGQFKF